MNLIAEPAQEVEVDGDELGQTPIRISVIPKALRVIVPA